jgi:hypothetical protein
MSVPSAPIIQEWPVCGLTTIQFFWDPPATGAPLTMYTLACPAISYTQDVSGDVTDFTVTGLTAGTEYDFTLTATNATGTSAPTPFPTVAPGLVPFGPSGATATRVNQTTALVTWTPSTIANQAPTRWYVISAEPTTGGASTLITTEYFFYNSTLFKGLSTNISYRFLVQGVASPGYCIPFAYSSTLQISQDYPLTVGSSTDVLTYARALDSNRSTQSPAAAGALTINSQSVGGHELTVVNSTTISSFTAASWFTSTADTQSAWVIVKGDLTINSGITFTPPVRKLFTVLYVRGNLVNNGTISMTARGASHSATTARNIRIATGTFSGVTNPQVPAAGGAGGVSGSGAGGFGTAGTSGGTGGGGGGPNSITPPTIGAGSAGTSYSGGSGGGAGGRTTAANAQPNGGAGGQAERGTNANAFDFEGGAGNPGGTNPFFTAPRNQGRSGTGGVLIVIVEGSITGTGLIQANGVVNENTLNWLTDPVNGTSALSYGGSTGGGSVTVMYGGSTSITPAASGGDISTVTQPWWTWGGSGGAGTARALQLA